MGDLHDGPAKNRVIIPAEFTKNLTSFGHVVETLLEPLDELQRMVFPFPRLEAAVACRLAPRLIHGRPPRTAPSGARAPGAGRWGQTGCGQIGRASCRERV